MKPIGSRDSELLDEMPPSKKSRKKNVLTPEAAKEKRWNEKFRSDHDKGIKEKQKYQPVFSKSMQYIACAILLACLLFPIIARFLCDYGFLPALAETNAFMLGIGASFLIVAVIFFAGAAESSHYWIGVILLSLGGTFLASAAAEYFDAGAAVFEAIAAAYPVLLL